MSNTSSAHSGSRINWSVRTAGAIVALIGFTSILGWMLDLSLAKVALLTLANLVVFNILVFWNVKWLSRVDPQRRRTEVQLRAVLETANDAIVSADSEGRIIYLNRSAARNFGYTAAEVVGQPLTVLMPERFRQAHLQGLERFRSTGEARVVGSTVELVAQRKDGSEFPVELSLANWKTDEGSAAMGFTGILRDITTRKQAEESLAQKTAELARSNKELEEFAYVASHDLQEPLRMVTSYVQLLERRYKGHLDAKADEFIRYAVDGAHRMRALINDLLAYSRVGRRGRAWQPISCDALVERALANLQVAIEESGAVVRYEPLPTVQADDGELTQLFQNLIGNAIKFRKPDEPPKVLVAAERRDGAWQFSVSDNGIGIDPQFADRIFAVFQRLHGRQEYPGTGIGLAICKKIAESLGGRIWVDSRPGEGATFSFTIPNEGGESS